MSIGNKQKKGHSHYNGRTCLRNVMFLSFLQYQSIPVVVICTSLGTLQYVSHVFNGANLLEASKQIPAKRHRAPNVVASPH